MEAKVISVIFWERKIFIVPSLLKYYLIYFFCSIYCNYLRVLYFTTIVEFTFISPFQLFTISFIAMEITDSKILYYERVTQ